MNFLSQKSYHLMQDLLPEMSHILNNRIANYLSFYLSYNGTHQYYSPHLLSNKKLNHIFLNMGETKKVQVNYQHLFAKSLLWINYQQHVIDEQGSYRMLTDLKQLSSCKKMDIVQQFLRIKCKLDGNDRIIHIGKENPVQKRRNVYISFNKDLPGQQELASTLMMNPFMQIPNLNKILVFNKNPQIRPQLHPQLQTFCNQFAIKIKLLDNHANIQTLMTYLYNQSKKTILIHQLIHGQKEIYSLKSANKTISFTKDKNNQNATISSKYRPQQILMFMQRLPLGSIAKNDKHSQQILTKMKDILCLQDNQDLIDPVKRLSFRTIEKNYRFEDVQDQFQQTTFNFKIRRFVTPEVFQFNRKEERNNLENKSP